MNRFPPEAFPKGTIVKWDVFKHEEPKECEVEYVVEPKLQIGLGKL